MSPLPDDRDVLLAERREEIVRLTARVDALMIDRVPAGEFNRLRERQAATAETLARVEVALFGPTGQDGIAGDVKTIAASLASIRETEFKDLADRLTTMQTTFRNWALTILCAFIAAGGTIYAAYLH